MLAVALGAPALMLAFVALVSASVARRLTASAILVAETQRVGAAMVPVVARSGRTVDAATGAAVVDAWREARREPGDDGAVRSAMLGQVVVMIVLAGVAGALVFAGLIQLRVPVDAVAMLGAATASVAAPLAIGASLLARPVRADLWFAVPMIEDPHEPDEDGDVLEGDDLAEAIAERDAELRVRAAGDRVLRERAIALDEEAHAEVERVASEAAREAGPAPRVLTIVRVLAIVAAVLAVVAIGIHLLGA